MDKFKIGDTVRFKTFDELFETYRSENRIQRSIRIQALFRDDKFFFTQQCILCWECLLKFLMFFLMEA